MLSESHWLRSTAAGVEGMRHMPEVMTWLRSGVPLTLGIDLLDPAGPDSARIMREEWPAAESLGWLHGIVGHVPEQHLSPDRQAEEAKRGQG